MKLNTKPKAQKTDTYTMRLEVSLIQQLKELRTQAEQLDEDFSATLQDLMKQAAKEYKEYLDHKAASVHKSYTERPPEVSTKSTTSNGAEPERA